MEDYYKILGLSQSASQDEIRRAYRRLAKEFHPDLNSSNQYAEEKFKKITAAYKTLSTSKDRATYDSTLTNERHRQYQKWASENHTSQQHTTQSSSGYQTYTDYNHQFYTNNRWQNYQSQQNQGNQQKSYTASAANSSYTTANNRTEQIEPRKSHVKKIFKIFSIIILFAGCICFYYFYRDNEANGLAGSYTLDSMTSEGETETAEHYERIAKIYKKMGIWEGDDKFGSLILKKSGAGTMTFEGESREVIWNSEKITVPEEDEIYTYTLERKSLIVYVSNETTLVFLQNKKHHWMFIIIIVIISIIGIIIKKRHSNSCF